MKPEIYYIFALSLNFCSLTLALIAFLWGRSLKKVRKEVSSLIFVSITKIRNKLNNFEDRGLALDLERHVRRIALFSNDSYIQLQTLLWFEENANDNDKVQISRALLIKVIKKKNNKEIAERIINK